MDPILINGWPYLSMFFFRPTLWRQGHDWIMIHERRKLPFFHEVFKGGLFEVQISVPDKNSPNLQHQEPKPHVAHTFYLALDDTPKFCMIKNQEVKSQIHRNMHVMFSFSGVIFLILQTKILTFSWDTHRYTKLSPGEKKTPPNSTPKKLSNPKNLRLRGDRCFELSSKHRSFEAPRSDTKKATGSLKPTASLPLWKWGTPWNFGDSYWTPAFLGAILVSGRVRSVNFFLIEKMSRPLVLEMTCE